MFEPHEDRRETSQPTGHRGLGGFVGFLIGCAIGWLAWDRLVLPHIRVEPTAANPDGEPAGWIYYGSLVLCLVATLLIVATISEMIGRRRSG